MVQIALSNGGAVNDYNGNLNVKLLNAQKALMSLTFFYNF